jgi:hypothetical protein
VRPFVRIGFDDDESSKVVEGHADGCDDVGLAGDFVELIIEAC